MTFKSLRLSDVSEIAKIEKLCFSSEAWTEQMIAETVSEKNFIGFICEDDNKTVGYVMSTYSFDEADLLNVAVIADYRRRGIADALINELLTSLTEKGVKKIFLEVRRGNFNAVNLYKKNNFVKISERKNYYGDEDALIFLKTVD